LALSTIEERSHEQANFHNLTHVLKPWKQNKNADVDEVWFGPHVPIISQIMGTLKRNIPHINLGI
jgi:hypothetical protein